MSSRQAATEGDGNHRVALPSQAHARVEIGRDSTGVLKPGGFWDDLVERCSAYPLFLRGGWMRACVARPGEMGRFVSASVADAGNRWVAGGLLRVEGHRAEFLGTGPGDYLDVAVDRSVDEATAGELKRAIVLAVLESCDVTEVHLKNLPSEQGTVAVLGNGFRGVHVARLRSGPAPTMDIDGADAVLKSKSVRRCENRLRKQGTVTCETFRVAEEILPRLDEFFDQHVRRWGGRRSPSLFESAESRELYRRLTTELAESGVLRFTEIRLSGKLAAAHYGFFDAGRFVWYKPTYEPAMAELSPGVVLIANLVRLAVEEGAKELDFTIGDEAFKSRYATREREVVDLLATKSWSRASRQRMLLAGRRRLKAGLTKIGVIGWVSGIWEWYRRP